MRITKYIAGFVTALALAGAAHAGPIQNPTVTLDPLGIGAFPTGSNAQQVCPLTIPPGCLGNFTTPANNFFSISMLNDGLFSASIIASITPGGSGSFANLSFQLRDSTGTTTLGSGQLGTNLQDLVLLAGSYRMYVFYNYTGVIDNSSASWSMTMTTAPIRQVPEPGTVALIGLTLTIVAVARRRRS